MSTIRQSCCKHNDYEGFEYFLADTLPLGRNALSIEEVPPKTRSTAVLCMGH